RLGQPVHLLPPGPERAPPALRPAPKRTLKGVRVGVGEAGERQAGKACGIRRRRRGAGGHGGDPPPLDLDENTGVDALAAEPPQLAPVAAAHLSRDWRVPLAWREVRANS